jgi:putative addiction module CopG family antidote
MPTSVTPTPQLEANIGEKVTGGLYDDAESVVQEALRPLDEHDRHRQRLRAAIAGGDEGEAIPCTPELMEQKTREAEEMVRQGIEPDPDVCP